MGTSLKEYMNMEETDETLPPEYSLPCASDSPKERLLHRAVRRLRHDEDDLPEGDQ
jgi:hypothetical protein